MVIINLLPTVHDVASRAFAGVMFGRRQVAGDTFAERSGVLALGVALSAGQIGVTSCEWIKAVIKIIAYELDVLGVNGRWLAAFGLDDDHELPGASGGAQGFQLVQ